MHSVLSSFSNSRESGPLVTAEQLVDIVGPGISVAAVRSQIWAAQRRTLRGGRAIEPNGLAPAIIRIGRKVLIDVPQYLAWLEARRLAPKVDLASARAACHER